MPHVPGLRSCYAKVGRLVYFGRMLDKIRLHAAGKLPPDYQANLGDSHMLTLDGRCCRFLGIRHAELKERVLRTGGLVPADPKDIGRKPDLRLTKKSLRGPTRTGRRAPTRNAICGTASS